ncbi:MAG: MCE family protein [Myxococcales bacterium]|nr:MCE family protein [Myxococcales bacterium]
MSQRSIEVKVGVLILLALGLLGGFVVIMGGLSFEPTYTVYINFETPGGLQTGAPVRIAGVKIGTVDEIEFRAGEVNPQTNEPVPPIRVVAKVQKKYQSSIHDNSRWYVTSQGVLGELFLAVDPGSYDRPVLADGTTVDGVSPPRLDLLLSESYELLHAAYTGITKNEKKISETFDGLHNTLTGTGNFFKKNDKKLDNIVTNVETLTVEANDTLKSARSRYVENPQINRIINNVETTTVTVNRNLGPLMKDTRAVMGDAKKLTGELSKPEQLARIDKITRDASEITGRAKVATGDVQAIVAHIKRGKGTVGALVMDEALYDDIQEMLRDLKHNPWKLFWRE